MAATEKMAANTLGRAYFEHMQACGIEPFALSDETLRMCADNLFALRYITTHDLVHTILGFDTSLAGEMGVYAFADARAKNRLPEGGLREGS